MITSILYAFSTKMVFSPIGENHQVSEKPLDNNFIILYSFTKR